jgi:outer membrane lipoprotein SlyB
MWCRKNFSPVVALALLVLSLPQTAFGQRETREVLAGKDVVFALELLSPLDTNTNQKGDKFHAKVLSPVQYEGAVVSGHVKKVKSSGKANKKSEMDLGFDRIMLADGRAGSFNAQIKEVNDVADAANDGRADVEGTLKGKSRIKISVKRAVLGAVGGAVIGGVFGGPKGAAMGAAIGGSIALSTVLATDGPNLEFKTGTQFTVQLNAPSYRQDVAEVEVATTRPAPPADKPAAGGQPPSLQRVQPARAQPTKPELPSATYRTYSAAANVYSLSVPDNWRESVSGSTHILAPDGASSVVRGQTNYTHCAMTGVVAANGLDLQRATEGLVRGVLQRSPYLRQQGNFTRGQIGNRPALSLVLSGTWPVTNRVEVVTVYTAMLRNGNLFFVLTVVPQEDVLLYRPVFVTMMRSLRIND